ncbi:hypothetical protein PHLGIDRAFT_119699 [Phlebiopsis gigantea 11061_1 CR5-6]|uniref:Uncharacterized protein n=1 Tax=Phlebiopsis gigantea (strain 11061_1 CR5-6) TaxID=745531 RepID=A0A0C3S8S8_PHLG1|nr:hypothetical protein PHLGIDRAFT_119699 [Phlebiopsis gigantea 11061_1 CR5-6]
MSSTSPTPTTTQLFLGHRSKTPTISGIVSGGAVALAWAIGFIIYFYKRHRREKRARALGFRSHREMLDPPKKPEAFIIPPDPAIVEGGLHPGERVYDDPKVAGADLPHRARTVPGAEMQKAAHETHGYPPQAIAHTASEPSRVADRSRATHSAASPPPRRFGHASPNGYHD